MTPKKKKKIINLHSSLIKVWLFVAIRKPLVSASLIYFDTFCFVSGFIKKKLFLHNRALTESRLKRWHTTAILKVQLLCCVYRVMLSLIMTLVQVCVRCMSKHRVLFIDFSSAFSLVQFLVYFLILVQRLIRPDLFLEKLKDMSVNPTLTRWFCSFLTNRTQQVKAQWDTVRDPTQQYGGPTRFILFTFYTNNCRKVNPNNYIIKFIKWRDINQLILNVTKTQELVYDRAIDHEPVVIKNQSNTQVSS